jgi:hypothetical protein
MKAAMSERTARCHQDDEEHEAPGRGGFHGVTAFRKRTEVCMMERTMPSAATAGT